MLRQSWLPGFPDGAQKVGKGLAILEKDGQVTYFVGGDKYFSHAAGDEASRRFALASLMENGHVKAAELERAPLNIPHRTLMNVSFRQSCKSAAALECGTAPGTGDTPWGCSSDEGKRREPPAGRRRAQGTAAGLVCRWQSADHRIDARHDQFTASPDSATASAWV